ncbi:MAG TPA: hypothetical protein VGT60_01350 [Candidatus Limnocylindria bacterium]|nr:hypothetical protein [Candidatus Limnocylindria bacterium]
MSTTERAWAAGFFDAEGSVVLRRQRRAWRMELEATQGGDCPPPVLLRLRSACSGLGSITGPRRGYLYYWRASRHADVSAVVSRLGPWITEPKRSAIESAAETVRRVVSLGADPDMDRDNELAWAAGFFGGDGTSSAAFDRSNGPDYRRLHIGIPQAAVNGRVPPVLPKFQAAVGGAGSIRGPYTLKNPWSRLPQYVWSLSGTPGGEHVLGMIWPWLDDAKRDQARRAMRAARAGGPHRPLPPPSAVFELD